MKYTLGITRLLAFLLLVLLFLPILGLARIISRKPDMMFAVLKQWSKAVMRLLGIKPEYTGNLPEESTLILPNHRSYIDVAFFCANVNASFLSKIEVKKWPLIGWGARIVKTVFVDRSSPNSRVQTKETIRERLVEGNSVVVFPEGTTTQAPTLLPLKRGMFHVAAEENLPVVPVAIEYKEVKDAWDGKESFLSHFITCFSKWRTHVKVDFGEIMKSPDSKDLHQQVTTWMGKRLGELQQEWGHSFPTNTLSFSIFKPNPSS